MESFVPNNDAVTMSSDVPMLEWFDGEPQFRLFVAGPSTAGKTVFLASLHKSLAVQGKKNTYFAKLTSDAQSEALFGKVDSIMNPEEGWPDSDTISKEYVFRCFHNASGVEKKFPLFRFHYVDFPGRDLTRPSEGQMIDVQHSIEMSHTVLFLLDGRKILDGMDKRSTRDRSIYQDLDKISILANSCIYRPIQFVITKWDILKHKKLRAVRKFLLRSESFGDVVKARRRASKPTYLIPVSAVGDKFARYDPSSSQMIKHADAVFNPYNLDVCLAAAITDTLMTSFRTSVSSRDLFWFNLLKACVGASAAVRWLGDKGRVLMNDGWAARIRDGLRGLGNLSHGEFSHFHDQAEKRIARINDRNSALDNVVMVQKLLVNAFLNEYPSANLLVNEEED